MINRTGVNTAILQVHVYLFVIEQLSLSLRGMPGMKIRM
jgi:hypothetical protein